MHIVHLSAPISIVNAVKLTWNCEDLPKAEELPELSREATSQSGDRTVGKASRFRKIRRTCIDLLQISTNYKYT